MLYFRRPEFLQNQDTLSKWEIMMKNWRENVFRTSNLENMEYSERWNRLYWSIKKSKLFQNDKASNFNPTDVQSDGFRMVQSCSIDDVSSISSVSQLNVNDKNADTISVNSITSNLDNTSFLRRDREGSQSLQSIAEHNSAEFSVEFPVFIDSVKNDSDHPFNKLIRNIQSLFCASYGNWKCKPVSILAKMAMEDWRFIMRSLYQLFKLFFDKLPDSSDEIDEETSSISNSIYEIFMNDEIYSCLFLLYASKSSKQDELYNQRLVVCEKKSNEELRGLLKIEPNLIPILEHQKFQEAIQNLQKISQKNCPIQMLNIIQTVFQNIEECSENLSPGILSADNLLSISIYLIIKASVNHLGAELSLMEDLINNEDAYKLINFQQYIYTTMKIGYLHTISSRFFHN